MLSNLPTYKITIDDEFSNGEDLGISAIAFVSNPAIQVKGFAFNEDTPQQQFFADKMKYRIVAPAMIPMQIYRADDSGEYYVEFTEKEVERIYSKFMKNFTNRQVFNLEHDDTDKVPAYVLESWIVENPLEDKAYSSYGIKVPKGTIMLTAQITDKETYNQIVENEQFAFSIEGFLGLSLSEIINKEKIKNEKMNKQKMNTQVGEFTKDNQLYTLMSDGTFSVSDISLEDDECKDCKDEADCKKCKEAKEAKEVQGNGCVFAASRESVARVGVSRLQT